MSGVQSGTRLERLHQLQRAARLQRAEARWKGHQHEHDRLDQLVSLITTEITLEEARLAAAAKQRPTIATAVRRTDQTVEERLRAMGVTTYAVKVWAVQQGLLPAVVRGRVSPLLVDAYATAHHTQETPSCEMCGQPVVLVDGAWQHVDPPADSNDRNRSVFHAR